MNGRKPSTRSKGNAAEEEAVRMLEAEGISCLERQYRSGRLEIDIIGYEARSKTLVFVEVKSGNSDTFPAYKEAITPAKLEKIIKVASIFIDNYKGVYENVRIDAVFIERGGRQKSEHLKNIAFIT